MPMLLRLITASALCVAASAASAADNCEPIRQRIEANIASKGVTGFSVTVVAASAEVAGDEVGRCGHGTRKIVYTRDGASPGNAPAVMQPVAPMPAKPASPSASGAAAPAKSVKGPPILTECKDGTVSMGGVCKR